MVKKRKTVNDFEKSSPIYFKEISKYKSLTKDEEFYLWQRYKYFNDITARDKIINSNLRFVANVAKKYQGLGLSYSDLIAEGNLGLIKAMDKFDASKGNKVITYSVWWIKQTILEALNKRNGLEGEELPEPHEKQFDDDDTINQSMDEYNQNEFIVDEFDKEYQYKEQKEAIKLMMYGLTNREKYVVIEYYGLNNDDTKTLEEIGKNIGLTKERIRQILCSAFKKMRSNALILNIDATIYK